MKKEKLRVGVVGLIVGAGHVADYSASGSVEELVICDLNERKLHEVGDTHGVKKRYANFTEMLAKEKLDAVSIALPNKLHMPMAIQALASGCHVLCEKPMARTAAEAQKMLDAARTYNKKLMINFNQRFAPFAQTVKQMITNGALGEIYFARTTWHRRRGVPRWYTLTKDICGGGPLIDLGVHMLDKTMWFCGYPEPEWVLGNAFSKIEVREFPDFELEDMGVAMIRMKNGSMLELEASWAANREGEELTTRIYGTKGGLLMSSTSKNQLFLELDGKLANVELVEGQCGNSPLGPKTNVRQAFLDAILNATEVPCTPEQGLIINKILDAIYQSAATGAPVQIDGGARSSIA